MNIILKTVSVILKVALALALGVLLAASLFKNDERVRGTLTEKAAPFLSRLVGGTVSCYVKNISLLPLSVELADVTCEPWEHEQGEWEWSCPSLTIGASWFDLLLYGTIALKLDMDRLHVTTRLEKSGLCAWKIISRIMSAPATIPTYVHTIRVPHGFLSLNQQEGDINAVLDYDLAIRKKSASLLGDIVVHRADATVQGRSVLENFHGPLSFTSRYLKNKVQVGITADCAVNLPQLPGTKACRVAGAWDGKVGEFFLAQDSGQRLVESLKMQAISGGLQCDVQARVPLAYVYGLAAGQEGESPVSGFCSACATVRMEHGKLDVDMRVHADQVQYAGVSLLTSATATCRRQGDGLWNGELTAHKEGMCSVVGTAQWNEKTASGFCQVNNDQQVLVPGITDWIFLPKSVEVRVQKESTGKVQGSLLCAVYNTKTKTKQTCDLTGTYTNKRLELQGTVDNKSLRVQCSFDRQPLLHQCTLADAQKNKLIDIRSRVKHPEHFVGTISLGFIKEILKRAGDIDFQGKGAVECVGMVQNKKLYAQLKLLDGSVRIPYTCNVVNGLQGRVIIDPEQRLAELRDVRCTLYRGTVFCPLATATWDQSYAITSVAAPLTLRDCLLNWKRDVFALLSGTITLTKNKEYLLAGDVVVDRAQVQQNILSQEVQKNFIGSSHAFFSQKKGHVLNFDVHVTTKNPVRVKTAFLETSAKIDVIAKGNLSKPDLVGRISLLSGMLHFPYKPLYITKGYIDFVPGRLSEPYFELSAKNKLKKYNVSLEVSGTPSGQDIVLEASPMLTEEQIIALLLVGSEQGSLNIVVPALIMQNLKSVIVGSDQSSAGVRKSFGRLLKPLERIHVVPSFVDQTGRGGLRAAVEIDVNDRCRAMIQKNFSLTEDTKVEIDYALSDDVNLRGVRDERGDIGAEIEMRWKF